jgi:hypothetical protein
MIPHIHKGEMWNCKKQTNYYNNCYMWVNFYKDITMKIHDVKCVKH